MGVSNRWYQDNDIDLHLPSGDFICLDHKLSRSMRKLYKNAPTWSQELLRQHVGDLGLMMD